MAYLHLVAHVRDRSIDLRTHDDAARLWSGLRRAFPASLSTMLMPDHIHLLEEGDDKELARRRLIRCLAGFAWGRGEHLWQTVPMPEPVRDRKKLQRTVRYIALNPCRGGLADDPLDWTWSTYRDLVGATVDPWVTLPRLRSAVRGRVCSSLEAFHHYVSSDPSVDVAGSAPPRSAAPGAVPNCPIDSVLDAASCSMRITRRDLRRSIPGRRLVVALARRQGWHDATAIAELLGVTDRAVRRLAGREAHGVPAAALCLGDTRLLPARRPTKTVRNPDRTEISWWKTLRNGLHFGPF